jgi:hypothetical protein
VILDWYIKLWFVNYLFIVQALDPRTRMVLFKMLNRGVFQEINGCISTGKEVRFIVFSAFCTCFIVWKGLGEPLLHIVLNCGSYLELVLGLPVHPISNSLII